MGFGKANTKFVKLTSPLHSLSDKQKVFVEHAAKGVPIQQAARLAGYTHPKVQASSILKSPQVSMALRYLAKRHEAVADMSRKKVMDGFLEAIEMAKIQGDAQNMVAGWREIGRMCGYYAPEVKKIEMNVTAKRVIGQLEALPDEELLKIIDVEGEVIEQEAGNVLENLQKASDAEP